VTFFLAVDENVTPVRRIESSIRFKTLLLQTNLLAWFCEAEVDFAGAALNHFRCEKYFPADNSLTDGSNRRFRRYVSEESNPLIGL